MKIPLRMVRAKAFGPAASVELIETDVNYWLSSQDPDDALTEEEFVDIEYHTDGTSFWCFVTYVDA